MFERHPQIPQHSFALTSTVLMLGCLSLFIFNSAYAQVANPSTGDTIATYCSSGTCHTPGGTTQAVAPPTHNPLSFPAIHPNLIGIQLSSTCLTYLKNNLNSTCLTYKDMLSLDNTNKHLAGDFTNIPYFHRLPPVVKNFFAFTNSPMVMVDPNNEFAIQAKMIIVNPQNFTWIDKSEDGLNGGQIARHHIDRRMIGCEEAQVSSNYTLIRDTIIYMESGCTVTSFNDTKLITQKEIPFSYNNQYSTLHYESYLEKIFHNHKFFNSYKPTGGLGPMNCINHKCTYTDPNVKVGYK